MASSTPSPSPACRTLSLLQLAETTMAQSLLVFLLADLRVLSATGRTHTKYEHVALDSDHSIRSSAAFAGASLPRYKSSGVTPAHVVAVLILEIQRQADTLEESRSPSERAQNDVWSRDFVELAQDLPSLLNSYKDYIASDLEDSFKVLKADYPLDTSTLEDGNEDSNTHFKKSKFSPEVLTSDEDMADSEELFGSLRARLPKSRPALMRRHEQRGKFTLEQVIDQLTHRPESNDKIDVPPQSSEYYNRQELATLLEQAIVSRDAAKLKCIVGLFKPGSIMRILMDSPTEVVWLQDRHAQYECTYAIAVDYSARHVILAFRGAYTINDWSHAADWNYRTTSNPIPEHYPNKPKNIKLHGGFHKYLFRVRKDTGTTKYDEIASKVSQYCALVGDGYTVTITGHSLGAALTTVMALYASTEERFTRNGPISAVTWGGPYVGGFQFADAVRHQENAEKLRLARFHNVGDGVPHLPVTLFAMTKKGAKHHHVGMNIRLPMIRTGVFKAFGQPQPSLSYNGPPKSFVRSVLRQWNNFYFINVPIRLWTVAKFHELVEHKRRLSLINKDQNASLLVRHTLEELYKQREELDIFKQVNGCMLGWRQRAE